MLSHITTPRSGLCLREVEYKKKAQNLLTPPPQVSLQPPQSPQESQDESTADKKSVFIEGIQLVAFVAVAIQLDSFYHDMCD